MLFFLLLALFWLNRSLASRSHSHLTLVIFNNKKSFFIYLDTNDASPLKMKISDSFFALLVKWYIHDIINHYDFFLSFLVSWKLCQFSFYQLPSMIKQKVHKTSVNLLFVSVCLSSTRSAHISDCTRWKLRTQLSNDLAFCEHRRRATFGAEDKKEKRERHQTTDNI